MSQLRLHNNQCRGCKGEPEFGFIEMPDNGSIVACRVCNKDYDTPKGRRQREFDAAMAQRTLSRKDQPHDR